MVAFLSSTSPSRRLATAFLTLVPLAASLPGTAGCVGHTFPVHVDGEPAVSALALGEHPEVAVTAADVIVEVRGSVFADPDREDLRGHIAERLRGHLGTGDGPDRLATTVTISSPDLPFVTFELGPRKELRYELESRLPDGRTVVSPPYDVVVDEPGDEWVGEGLWAPSFVMAWMVGLVGSTAAGAAMTSVFLPPTDLSFLSGAPLVFLVALAALVIVPTLAPLFVFGLGGSAALVVVGWWLGSRQNQRAVDGLASAVELHARDVVAALRTPPAAAAVDDSPSRPSDQAPDVLGVTDGPDGDEEGAPTPVPALNWSVRVSDDTGCLDEDHLRRELLAWLPEGRSAQALDLVATVTRPPDGADRRSVNVEVRSADGELIAEKSAELDSGDCGEVARLLAQAIRRQLDARQP